MKFHPEIPSEAIDAAVALLPPGALKYRHLHLFGFAATLRTPELLNLVRSIPGVKYVEHAVIMHKASVYDTTSSPLGPAMWDIDTLDGSDYDNKYDDGGNNGAGVTAFVIDTGVRPTHNEFAGGRATAIAVSPLNGGIDDEGHGSHVSGSIAGATVGVARAVHIQAWKALDNQGSGLNTDINAGLDYAIANKGTFGPTVVSMSLGGGYSQASNDAVAHAVANGIPVVVAAGNSAADACQTSPASEPTAFTVGAIVPYPSGSATPNSGEWIESFFSNTGSCLDIYGPGGDANIPPQARPTSYQVVSSIFDADNSYLRESGTSQATPHVTGVIASYFGKNPHATPAQIYAAVLAQAKPNSVHLFANPASMAPQPYLQQFKHLTSSGVRTALIILGVVGGVVVLGVVGAVVLVSTGVIASPFAAGGGASKGYNTNYNPNSNPPPAPAGYNQSQSASTRSPRRGKDASSNKSPNRSNKSPRGQNNGGGQVKYI